MTNYSEDFPDSLAPPRVPLGFVRSTLFCVSRGTRLLDNEPLAISPVRGAKLVYSGPKLSQHHAMLWQAIVQIAMDQRTKGDEPFHSSCDELLRAMGTKGNDTKQRARVSSWLQELAASRVQYETNIQAYNGPLLGGAWREKTGAKLTLRLNEGLISLLENEVLKNDLLRKAALGQNLLALWLHDYLASHLKPPPEKVDTLRLWSGSVLALPQFRQRLLASLGALKNGADPLVLSWKLSRKDQLFVEKAKTSVVILPKAIENAKRQGSQRQEREWKAIQKSRDARARVAL